VLLVASQRFLNVEILKFADGFFEQNVAVQHVVDQGFKAGTHLHLAFQKERARISR
jgi:hypothetical protein